MLCISCKPSPSPILMSVTTSEQEFCRNAAMPSATPPAVATSHPDCRKLASSAVRIANSSSTISKSLTDFLQVHQVNRKGAALPEAAFDVNASAMLLDHLLADR